MSTQAKTLLAKLLATENIVVEHRKTQTAYFNVKERVMVLPIWKEMTPEVYDLLIGHEVGHALFTPPEGWHDSIKDNLDKKIGFKSYLNVVEDARIEKLMQEKFPGLKASFKKGYQKLYDQDFFGVRENGWDIQELPFIDRVNLHFKIGAYLNIQFEEEEQEFIDKILEMRSWKDVVQIADELYEYGKNEPNRLNWDDLDYAIFETDLDSDGMPVSDIGDDYVPGSGSGLNNENEKGERPPMSMTDNHFRKMEQTLVDPSVLPYVYTNCPIPDLKEIVIPYKRISKMYDEFVGTDIEGNVLSRKELTKRVFAAKDYVYKKFMDTNKKYINYLVKEFELKRNARQFARAATAKTGQLDVKRIHQYKFNDDLFKRSTIVPEGKSHGLLMFIDYSGSMSENIEATIEQTIILAVFCRKVNIPFRVFSFIDSSLNRELINKEYDTDIQTDYDLYHYFENRPSKFSKRKDDLVLDDHSFRLREYLSSEMTSTEFRDAIRYWLLVAELHGNRNQTWGYSSYRQFKTIHKSVEGLNYTSFESLNGTPLNETVVSAIGLAKEFRKKYKLDIVNTIFLTDGDGSGGYAKYKDNGRAIGFDYTHDNFNLIVRDTETMHEGKKIPGAEPTVALLELLRKVTGANAIGFFIAPNYCKSLISNRLKHAGVSVPDFETEYRKSKNQKFFMINNGGYDDFYIIPGGKNLAVAEDELEVDANATKRDLKNAFLKMQKNKLVNRVLLSRFISKIA